MSVRPHTLRVATLNIWNKSESWEARAAIIRDELGRIDADVVGLQEVVLFEGVTQAHELARGLYEHVAFGAASEPGPGIGFGNAILSRWPLVSVECLRLPSAGTRDRRAALSAHVDTPRGTLPFFVTHLSWQLDHGFVREAQVLALDAWARAQVAAAPRALPAVLVGDLNAEPDSAELRFLRGLQSLEARSTHWADTFALAGRGPGATYDRLRNGYAAPNLQAVRRLDYVLTRGPDERGRGLALDCEVVFVEPRGGVWASDHFGVLATLSC